MGMCLERSKVGARRSFNVMESVDFWLQFSFFSFYLFMFLMCYLPSSRIYLTELVSHVFRGPYSENITFVLSSFLGFIPVISNYMS